MKKMKTTSFPKAMAQEWVDYMINNVKTTMMGTWYSIDVFYDFYLHTKPDSTDKPPSIDVFAVALGRVASTKNHGFYLQDHLEGTDVGN